MSQNVKRKLVLKLNQNAKLGSGLMIIAMIIFPITDATAKSFEGAVPVLIIVWFRLFGSAVLLTIYVVIRGIPSVPKKPDLIIQAVRALMIIAAFSCFVLSFETISFAEAMTFYMISPIIAAGLAVVFLGERLSSQKLLSLIIGFIGVLIVLNPTVTPQVGALYAIATGGIYGSFLVLSRFVATRSDNMMALVLQFWFGTLFLIPFIWGDLSVELTPYFSKFLLMAAISVLCNVLMITAFKSAEAGFLAPFMYVEIIAAFAISALFFNEPITFNIFIGAAVIVGAGILALSSSKSTQTNQGENDA